MKFLGLDLSTTHTGLVCVEAKGLDGWKVERELLLAPKSKVVDERIDAIIEGLLRNFGADLVAIEAIAAGGVMRGTAIIPMSKLHGVVEYQLRRLSMPYITVAPATWRKALLGHGGLKKELVAKEVWKRYGYEHASLDVVEAWCVAVYACRQRQGALTPEPIRSKKAKALELEEELGQAAFIEV